MARLVPANSPRGLKGRFAGVAAIVADEEELFGTGVDWDVE